MIEVTLPRLASAQHQSWLALIELGERMSSGWTIVGGQLIHLHCFERGGSPGRPTDDGDAALDVRAHPEILRDFTRVLTEIGFEPDPPDWRGHQHRWRRSDAVIDVLIPRFLGERAESRRGISGGTTVAAPGAQKALDRTELVRVTVGDAIGTVPRPDLVGAIAAKAAALEIPVDRSWRRHVQDLAILSTLLTARDDLSVYTAREIARVRNAIGRTAIDRSLVAAIPDARYGLARLIQGLENVEQRRARGEFRAPGANERTRADGGFI